MPLRTCVPLPGLTRVSVPEAFWIVPEQGAAGAAVADGQRAAAAQNRVVDRAAAVQPRRPPRLNPFRSNETGG